MSDEQTRTTDDQGRTVDEINTKYRDLLPDGFAFAIGERDGCWYLGDKEGNDVVYGSADPEDEIRAAIERATQHRDLRSKTWELERMEKRWIAAITEAGLNPEIDYNTSEAKRIQEAINNRANDIVKADPASVVGRVFQVPWGSWVSTANTPEGPRFTCRVLGHQATDTTAFGALLLAIEAASKTMSDWHRKVGVNVTPDEAADEVVRARKEAADARADAAAARMAAEQILRPLVEQAIASMKA